MFTVSAGRRATIDVATGSGTVTIDLTPTESDSKR